MLQIKFLSNQEVAGGLRRFSAEAEPLKNPHKNTPSGHNFRADPHKNRNQNPHKNFWSVPEPKMPNPYITSAQELAAYIRSPDDEPKRRPIWGVPGLHIIKKDSRWSYLFEHQGRRYHGTLGTYPKVQLKEAKATYQRKRFAITDGLVSKPRRTQRKKKQTISTCSPSVLASSSPKFNDIRTQYFRYRLEQLQSQGSNKVPTKAVARMEELFDRFALPIIGELPVAELGNSHIIKILSSIESDASRVKLKAVLSILVQWLVQQSLLDPDRLNINWRVINGMLPRSTKASNSYPRVGIADIPRFIAYALRPRETFRDNILGTSLAFLTLTAQRAGPIFSPDTAPIGDNVNLFCHWENVDFEAGILSIPSAYMKVSQINGVSLPPFRVPLSKEAIWCLRKVQQLWRDLGITLKPADFLIPQYDDPSFPQKAFALRTFITKTLHQEALRETGRGFFDPDQTDKVATTHGLRSSFADWAASNGYAEDLIEKALAHTMPKIQRAYRRDDLLEARRSMMDAWGAYCFSELPFEV